MLKYMEKLCLSNFSTNKSYETGINNTRKMAGSLSNTKQPNRRHSFVCNHGTTKHALTTHEENLAHYLMCVSIASDDDHFFFILSCESVGGSQAYPCTEASVTVQAKQPNRTHTVSSVTTVQLNTH